MWSMAGCGRQDGLKIALSVLLDLCFQQLNFDTQALDELLCGRAAILIVRRPRALEDISRCEDIERKGYLVPL
jgi:hypothetical protein